jgi:hypothetical protein
MNDVSAELERLHTENDRLVKALNTQLYFYHAWRNHHPGYDVTPEGIITMIIGVANAELIHISSDQ